ncbi:MAG: hypothetical protein EBS30_16885, partial [Planctomycetes bacterium]|nr:hypothetical protein [Planctomycetota bacterium]
SVADDTGVSATDRITKDTTPTLSGTTEAGSTVEIFANGATVGLATVVGGNWTFVSKALGEGLTSFTAKSTDLAGNVSVATLPTGVTVDTIAPNVPVIVSAVGASAIVTAGFRKDAALTVSGTAEASSTVELWDNAISLGTVTTNAQGQWSKSLTGLTEASHGFKARATDLAGNIGSISAAFTVIVDLTAPNTPIFSGPGLSKVTTPTLIGTSEAFATVTVTIAGSDYLATADSSGNWELNLVTAGVALAEGSNGLVLKSRDRAGNSSSTTTGTVVVDTIAPDIIFDAVTGDDRISKVELAGTITLTGTNELGASVSVRHIERSAHHHRHGVDLHADFRRSDRHRCRSDDQHCRHGDRYRRQFNQQDTCCLDKQCGGSR